MLKRFPPPKKPKTENDNCKIKIKKTASGEVIEFSGKCSKEQIEIAKPHKGIDLE